MGPTEGATGHRPIVAPLSGATLVAVGVGVALALAKAQRRRRSGRAPRVPSASAAGRRCSPASPSREGLRRVILGQLDLAIELLEAPGEVGGSRTGGGAADDPARSGAHTVHETRKALKRLRALLALLRTEVGDQALRA